MAWEISHTADALDNARENLLRWPRKELIAAYREAFGKCPRNVRRYASDEALADTIWDNAINNIRSTDNGGFNLYLDDNGFYTVSFDLEEANNEE